MNNYGKPVQPLLDGARDALGAGFNTIPLVQAQFGVFPTGTWDSQAGTTMEAARSMAALEQALGIPDLQVFTFSGWLSHMIAYRGGQAVQLPLFNALKLFARMPDHRAPVQGPLPSGVGAMASGDEYRSSVMVWSNNDEPLSITLQLSGVADPPGAGPSGARASGTELRVYHIDAGHGSPLEHSGDEFTATESVRLPGDSGKLSRTVTVAGPGIAYVEIGNASRYPVLDRGGLPATLVRKHTYADRTIGADGTTSVRGNAYGCYDAVRALAYLGIEGNQDTALLRRGVPRPARHPDHRHLDRPAGRRARITSGAARRPDRLPARGRRRQERALARRHLQRPPDRSPALGDEAARPRMFCCPRPRSTARTLASATWSLP